MKKFLTFLACLTLVLGLASPAFASGGSPKIVDDADLLYTSEEAALETRAVALAEKYQIDVVIVTVNSTGYQDETAYADDFFDYNGYGCGSNDSGVLLLLSMEERDWVVSTHSDGKSAVSRRGADNIMEQVTPYLKQNNYYEGFSAYLDQLDTYFAAYRSGEPIADKLSFSEIAVYVLIALGVGALAGFITITVMKSGMKTAVFQRGAGNYVVSGSYQLRGQRDIFLYSRVTRVRRSSDSSGSHRSSSGRSHGGSRGKF